MFLILVQKKDILNHVNGGTSWQVGEGAFSSHVSATVPSNNGNDDIAAYDAKINARRDNRSGKSTNHHNFLTLFCTILIFCSHIFSNEFS